jgi:hypothetical protein
VSPHFEVSRSHSDTLHLVVLLWTSDRPEAETLPENEQHARQTDIHTPGRVSNPRSQQAKGRRATFQTAQSCRLKDCEWRAFIRSTLLHSVLLDRLWLLGARRVSCHSPEDRRLQLCFYCVRSDLQSKTERRNFDSATKKKVCAVNCM